MAHQRTHHSALRTFLCWVAMAVSSSGAVIYSGEQNILIPSDFEGVYLNVETGVHGNSPILGSYVNLFFGGVGVFHEGEFQPVRVTTDSFSAIRKLTLGTVIGSGSVFGTDSVGGSGDIGSEHMGPGAMQFQAGVQGFMGFKLTSATPVYGWMRVTFDASGGTIHDWAYDDSGDPMGAGLLSLMSVPEPGRIGLLLVGALGIVLRRRRWPLHVAMWMGVVSGAHALDQDGDGLSDVFQRRYALPTGANATTRDTDGDGQSDLTEFLFKTDPTSATSVPNAKPQFQPSGIFTLKTAVPGAMYGLEVSTNLRTWTQSIAPALATSSTHTITVTPAPGYVPRKFFRFMVPTAQPDVDGDGLNVIEEQLFGTSDTEADVDGDGYNDAEEFINGFDPLVPNNTAPIVNFASPAGAQFDLGSLLSLQVTVADSDVGDSVSLSFYEGTNQLGSTLNAGSGGTFDLDHNNAAAGPHIFLAKATDSRGKTSWAAIPIYVRQPPTDDETYGPIEGSMKFTIAASSTDLRSNPFLRPPLFAGAIGAVSGDTLSFNEQPGWNYGAFSTGHYVYVRSGSRLGAIIRVAGNDPHTLKLDSATHGLVAGDLISLVPQWTLDTMLPPDSVRATTNVHVAAIDFGMPSETDAYHLATGVGWVKGSGAVAESVLLPPWGTFSIRHASGTASTILRLQGDIATGTRRLTIPASGSANGMTLAPIAFQSMSLDELGLKDSTFVRNATADYVDIAAPGGNTLRWQLMDQKWVPASGTADGSSLVILPGGAITIGRTAPFPTETTWQQPFGK